MKILKKLTGLCMVFLLAGQICFPQNAQGISIREEEDLGREFMKIATKKYRYIRDPLITDYVNGVGHKLLATMPAQPFPYRFFVIRQDVFNAFAGPAGNIFVNSGLIEAMENEDELAGILAHEIIHVKARHISQKIERSSKMGLASLAGLVAGVFLGVGGAGAAAQAVTVGSMAATQSASLAYSRQDEMQADELGIQYLTRAGYNGEGLLTVLRKIRDTQWYGTDQVPSYLMTHPAVEDRIAYLDTWIEGHPRPPKKNAADKDRFRQIHTRLVAAYGDKEMALRKMTVALEKSPDNPLYNHGYGIALARNDNPKEGIIYVKKALQACPLDPCLLKDLGEIYFMDGQYKNAHAALEGSIGILPDDYETLFLLGRTRLELGMFTDAARAFERLLEKKPKYSQARYHLGEAYGKEGKLGDAHYHLGIYYRDRGEFRNAVFHLRQVLKYSNDPARKDEAEEMLSGLRTKASRQDAPPVQKPRSPFGPGQSGFNSGQNGKSAW
ncbi:peptidase M48 Ste24p [Desulfonema ishimotonii]|uniref:Peptidase M48 Ste24p n=2 Tax=Desulfonema ishimotonii TaxID=45657 RepID=A0A401G4C8_9BACT|nr:peptidase M48 Ste24p [Desulfonema ishimotonii]